jgi:hypothetical protein
MNLVKRLNKPKISAVSIFFILYFFVGLFISNDYGIPWDEPIQRNLGYLNYNFVIHNDTTLLSHHDRYYGPILEIILVVAEKILPLATSKAIFNMRHMLNFMVFYLGTIFFYLLCKKRFKRRWLALAGSTFLIISPRIFAHSFYNSKDLPFMGLFIVSSYFLLNFLEKTNTKNAIILGVFAATLTAIRVLGILIPAFAIFFFLVNVLLNKKHMKLNSKETITAFLALISIYSLFTILFWPVLWHNPLVGFYNAIQQMSQFPWEGTVLYLGEFISSSQLPWHYLLVWILVTTPVIYSLFFLVGATQIIISIFKKPRRLNKSILRDLVIMAWLFIPLVSIIATNAVLYDAWRHVFFVYPAFIYIAILGLSSTSTNLKIIFSKHKAFIKPGLISILAFMLISTIVFMVKNHPFQNMYFNFLAGNKTKIKQHLEMDYWGLSFRDGLEYLVKTDKRPQIKVFSVYYPAMTNTLMLETNDQKRITFTKTPPEAEYILTNFRWQNKNLDLNKYYELTVDGMNIMTVYSLLAD